jgi:glutathione S-transferase
MTTRNGPMPRLKLQYFDFDGGRGETARLCLAVSGIEYADHRIGSTEWPLAREAMPFRAIPVLEIDGRVLTQSDAINRFVGKLANLYPEDPLQAAYCDEVLGVVEDLFVAFGSALQHQGDGMKQARDTFVLESLPVYLQGLARLLAERGGKYFADDRLTVGDLKVLVIIRALRSGSFEHIPADIVDRLAPSIIEHADRVGAEPAIARHYST